MNKKISIFYISTVIVAVVCLILDLIFTNNSFSFLGICFGITMLVYGLCLIIRGLQLKIDSSLFLGIVIVCFGIVALLNDFATYNYLDLWHYFLLGLSLASFITGVYFKTNAQKKLSILFLGMFILALLFQMRIFNIWIMLISIFVWSLVFIVGNNICSNRRK